MSLTVCVNWRGRGTEYLTDVAAVIHEGNYARICRDGKEDKLLDVAPGAEIMSVCVVAS